MQRENLKSKRWAFIVNPVAGGGYAASYEPEARRKVAELGLNAVWIRTEAPGHAKTLAARFVADGFGVIAVLGGDGTLSEAAQGMHGSETVIAPIAAGTGNDFVSITGFSEHFQESDWTALIEGNVARMDLGLCNGRRFINGMGFGFDAAVAAANYDEEGRPKPGGKNKYMFHILKTLVSYREGMVRYRPARGADNEAGSIGAEFSDYAFLNTIAVGRRMAGGFYLTPSSIADDGLLDFCRIERLSIPARLRYLAAVMGRKHETLPKTHMSRIESLHVSFDKESPYHVDGELLFAKELEIGIEKAALRIAVNPARTDAFRS
jgi:diacylglycerol kinase (ATP)